MTERENYLSLVRRTGYEKIPVNFSLCPSLEDSFKKRNVGGIPYSDFFNFSLQTFDDKELSCNDSSVYYKYYDNLKPGAIIDIWGVAHEPGSAAAFHMTRMRHPLASIESLDEMKAFPFPVFKETSAERLKSTIHEIKSRDKISAGPMAFSVWETAWAIRSMEELMSDMMDENEKAEWLLNKVSMLLVSKVEAYARAGVDVIIMGDDIGMQHSLMMSERMYCDWLKPKHKMIISAAKKANPDIIISYHSCGYIKPFIPHLIDIGVDILNPVQPECMDFEEIYKEFGNNISFSGTIGTQRLMPFGTPDEVKREVNKNLGIAGSKGGLLPQPTHLLEPEVPWDNIEAYVAACREYVK